MGVGADMWPVAVKRRESLQAQAAAVASSAEPGSPLKDLIPASYPDQQSSHPISSARHPSPALLRSAGKPGYNPSQSSPPLPDLYCMPGFQDLGTDVDLGFR